MQRSDLPFGSEFSPSQIDLTRLLELASQHAGNWKAFEEAIKKEYFDKNQTSDYNKGKLANNTKLSMIAYELIDRDIHFTEFRQRLYTVKDDQAKLYEEFARHILLHLYGMALVRCVQDIQAAGETVDLIKLRTWLDQRGIHFPRGGKHPSIMHLWLEKAGIFVGGWRINENRLQQIVGVSIAEIEAIAHFTVEQRTYLKTLANVGGTGPYSSNDIEKLATATYGVKYNEKNLPKSTLYPLRDADYITLERGTKDDGRGAKPFMVSPTDKLRTDLILPLIQQLEQQVGPNLIALQRKPLADILTELRATDTYTRGLALEALAFKLMRFLDLNYMYTRLRGTATGGAEVDVLFESSRLVYCRWQVQCKNTTYVALDDVAKEVGLTHFLKSNVIVIVSTGTIGSEARRYANKIMQDSNLCVIMVDRADIQAIEQNPTVIVDIFNREAKHAMKLKVLDVKEA